MHLTISQQHWKARLLSIWWMSSAGLSTIWIFRQIFFCTAYQDPDLEEISLVFSENASLEIVPKETWPLPVKMRYHYKQTRTLCNLSLPPANEVWGKVIFLHQFVILFTGGRAWFYSGGCAWLLLGGMCGCSWGGMHGCSGGCAWFYSGGHVWFYSGGVHGFIWGACMVLFGGHAWFYLGGRAWFFQFFRIQWDTVNERAVRILLECILVFKIPLVSWAKVKTAYILILSNKTKFAWWQIWYFCVPV